MIHDIVKVITCFIDNRTKNLLSGSFSSSKSEYVQCSRISQTVDPEIKYPHLIQLNNHVQFDADIDQAISL